MREQKKHNTARDVSYALDVPHMAGELRLQLHRYIEAQYPIRHPDIITKRQALLEQAEAISQEPFIESMPSYQFGPAYHDLALPPLLTRALTEMASGSSPLIPARLYQHQVNALEAMLHQDRDLIVVTGTGSGKTESFLLPILLRSIAEACTCPASFALPGMRALLLYPMNALVNDQLTRLRQLFGAPRLATWLQQSAHNTRPLRFGMYTSRTPYPGLMSKDKNKRQLLPLLDYYLQFDATQTEQARELRQNGRWPALDLQALRDAANEGRISVGHNDRELYTRHQIQEWCPDVLVTNYSMLEYMLMRPIEQTLFQQTATWLKQDQSNTLLIVLDEAHLYSGVTGAEIALLLRRLQARLGVQRERVRYILTSASLDLGEKGPNDILHFASTLVGTRGESKQCFTIIEGKRLDPPPTDLQSTPVTEANALAHFDLQAFANRAADLAKAQQAVISLANDLNWPTSGIAEDMARYLGQQLPHLHTFQQLWNSTAGSAIPFQQLAQQLFSSLAPNQRSVPASALLSLAAAARTADERPLLPVRAHLFFRGLPPLYACINPHCSRRKADDEAPGVLGSLWLSPRLHCDCGARVYELYAHRNCGALFLRAFAPAGSATFYWHEPGSGTEQLTETLLLVGTPHPQADQYEEVKLHIMTGRAISTEHIKRNPFWTLQEQDFIRVYRPTAVKKSKGKYETAASSAPEKRWHSCPVCRKQRLNRSISSLSTKGEQPFVNLVRRQFELQPPSTSFHEVAPNMGRKVLLFSDGRQRAARLARDLPREVELDTFRQALLLAVARSSRRNKDSLVRMDQNLYCEFIAICTAYRLYFFDGESQKDLLHSMQDFRENYDQDIEQALDEEWGPAISQGYRLALLRQIADPFYSMQRICAAVVEPTPAVLRQLKKQPLFKSRLTDQQLRALVIYWIEELLEESAFDPTISPHDRENTVPGSGFDHTSLHWNDAENAAHTLLHYQKDELGSLRRVLVDALCEKKQERAYLNPTKVAIRLTLDESWYQCQDCARLIWLPLDNRCPNPRCGSTHLEQLPGNDPSLRARTAFYREPIRQVIAGMRPTI